MHRILQKKKRESDVALNKRFCGGKKMLGGKNADTLTVGLMYATSLPLTSPNAQHSPLWALNDICILYIWIKWVKFVISHPPQVNMYRMGEFPRVHSHSHSSNAHHNTWVSTKRSVHRRINRWIEWVWLQGHSVVIGERFLLWPHISILAPAHLLSNCIFYGPIKLSI